MEENLREAACIGNEDAVISYIKAGVNVNSQNVVNGWSALHWAAKRSNTAIVRCLLQAGADPELTNNDDLSAHELTYNWEIKKLLGNEDAEPRAASTDLRSNETVFVPNYMSHPQFPHVNNESNEGSSSSYKKVTPSSLKKEKVQTTCGGFIFQPTSVIRVGENLFSPCGLPVHPQELILKVRLADSQKGSDFTEVIIDRTTAPAFDKLQALLCIELGLEQSYQNLKVRKLPNTLIRNDKDVSRLTDYQELEVILSSVFCASDP
ncbi:unnamed protein product [Clavelina lepadiformis]|uniref:Ankyrin repeat domain-containing protein 40 n=1 Tax=Clavelina lepadiformis TaxID=159417 RepID=A0ABP0F210_CLALP